MYAYAYAYARTGVPKVEHERFMAATQQSIIDGSSKWSAKVAITVICAQVIFALL